MRSSGSKMFQGIDISVLGKANELKKRILFTILALLVYRLGAYIPIPSINPMILQQITTENSGGILGMFNMLSGGALGRMTIFALSMMPYITASIIIQLMTTMSRTLEAMKKEGEAGRKRINQLTRYGTVFLSAVQGYGIAVGLESMVTSTGSVVINPGLFFELTTVVTLVGGTLFLMWLGEQITSRGIGNGISLIIFTGIVAGLPGALGRTFELGRTGAMSPFVILAMLILALAMVGFIVFMERAQRRIFVQYPKRQVGNKVYGGENTHIPLKLNTSGVIPPIFASSLLLFPLTIANFSVEKSGFLREIAYYLGHGKPLYILLYAALIIFFCFFYTSVVFNPTETAENLRKNGGFIPGRRPGPNTAEYLDYVLSRLTVIGAAYITTVCVIPEVLLSKFAIPFYLGGTSVLIVVNVATDTLTQIQTHLFAYQYEGLIKKAKLRGMK